MKRYTRVYVNYNDDDVYVPTYKDTINYVLFCFYLQTAPYGMLKESEKPLSGNDRFEGFAIDIIHELSLIEKFNYTIIIREDKANGDWNNATGQWSGMIGDVLKGVKNVLLID